MTTPAELPKLYPPTPPEFAKKGIDLLIEAEKPNVDEKLSDVEKQEVLQWERNLTKGIISKPTSKTLSPVETLLEMTKNPQLQETEKIVGIEEIYKTNVPTLTFSLEYFKTEKGKKELAGLPPKSAKTLTPADVKRKLSQIRPGDKAYSDAVAKLAGNSRDYGEQKMLDKFMAQREKWDHVPLPTKFSVVQNPTNLANNIWNLRVLKRELKEIRRNITHSDTDGPTECEEGGFKPSKIEKAKLILLEAHQRRINVMLIESYGHVLTLIDQVDAGDTLSETELYAIMNGNIGVPSRLVGVSKILRNESSANDSESKEHQDAKKPVNKNDEKRMQAEKSRLRIMEKIDKLKHGTTDEFKVIDPQLETLFEGSPKKEDNTTNDEPILTQDQIAKARQIKITPVEYKSWFEEVLTKYDILSSDQSEFNFSDPKPASDGKWRVVLNPSAKVLDVSNKLKTIYLPASEDRFLHAPTKGAIVTMQHEIAHAIQEENKIRLGGDTGIGLMNIGMGRTSLNHEAGAIMWESEAKKRWFGEDRPVNPHYLRAAQKRLEGKGYRECVKAYYESQLEQNKDDLSAGLTQKRDLAKLAIKNTSRIFGKGSPFQSKVAHLTNSKALAYVEQEILIQRLRQVGMTDLLLLGGVNYDLLAEMIRIGLVDLSSLKIPDRSPSEIIKDKILAKINESDLN